MTPAERSQLFETLSELSLDDFGWLVFSLKPPAGIVPPDIAPQKSRVAALLEWADSFGGCGLSEVQSWLNKLGTMTTSQNPFTARFQGYLDLVCNEYQNYWKRYAFIDEIREEWFEFDLNTEVEKKNDQEDNTSEKPKKEKQSILKAIRKNGCKSLLIHGKSGSGKSTLLAKLFCEAALKAQGSDSDLIPVLIELKSYEAVGESPGLQGLILRTLQNYDPELGENDLTQIRKRKKLLLFIDGFNELADEKAKIKIKDYCKNIPTIATSRSASDWREIEKKLEIDPLSPQEVTSFFRERLPGSSQADLEALGSRVRDFGETPLIVWMLYSIFNTSKEIPETRGEAYRRFTTLYVEQAKEGIDLAESRILLGKLAFKMMQSCSSNESSEFRLEISEIEAQNVLASEATLKLLRNCHLLNSYGQSGNRRISFCHQSLQEYYVAEELLIRLNHEDVDLTDDQRFQHFYLNQTKWTESLTIFAGFPELNEGFIERLLGLSINVDWILGAKLIRSVAPLHIQERAIEILTDTTKILENSEISDWLKIELLGMTQSSTVLPMLSNFLVHSNPIFAQRAVFWVGNLISEDAIDFLLKTIEKTELWVLTDDNSGLPSLYRTWSHRNFAVKVEAISALSKLDEEKAATLIRDTFNDSHCIIHFVEQPKLGSLLAKLDPDFVRKQAFEFINNDRGRKSCNHVGLVLDLLSRIDSDISLVIARLCREKDRFVKDSLINGLGKFNQDVAAETLVNLIKEGSSYERKKSSESLIRHWRVNASPYLVEILRDSSLDWDIRWCASVVLGKFGNHHSIPILIEALTSDGNRQTQISAAELLASFEAEDVITALINALQDTDYGVRRGAAVSLAYFDREEAIAELIKALWHYFPQKEFYQGSEVIYKWNGGSETSILGMSYEDLASLGGNEAIQAWLFERSGIGAREQAAFALENFKTDEVIHELRRALHQGLKAAAIPLAMLGFKDGLPVLIEILKDISQFAYDRQSIIALLHLVSEGSVEIIPLLVEILENISKEGEPTDFRFLNRVVTVLENIDHEFMPTYLPQLTKLLSSEIGNQVYRIIDSIQARSGIYNYKISQLELQPISNHLSIGTSPVFNIQQVGNLNSGSVTIFGDQKGIAN